MTFDLVGGAVVPPTPAGELPRCAADCVNHILLLPYKDRELAIAKINLLMQVARSDAAIEAIETSHRRILKILNAPLSASEVEP